MHWVLTSTVVRVDPTTTVLSGGRASVFLVRVRVRVHVTVSVVVVVDRAVSVTVWVGSEIGHEIEFMVKTDVERLTTVTVVDRDRVAVLVAVLTVVLVVDTTKTVSVVVVRLCWLMVMTVKE